MLRKNSELTFHHVFCNKKALNNTMFQLEIAIELCVSHGPCSKDKSINFQQKLGQMPMVTFPPQKTSFLLLNKIMLSEHRGFTLNKCILNGEHMINHGFLGVLPQIFYAEDAIFLHYVS